MFRFNRAEISQSLAEWLGAKGHLELDASRDLAPVVQIGNVLDSPYSRYGDPVADESSVAGVAAEFGHVVATPQRGKILQIKRIFIGWTAGAAGAQTIIMRRLTAADIATAGLVVGQNFKKLNARDSGDITASSQILSGTHTVTSLGDGILVLVVPANGSVDYVFQGPGIFLYGNDPLGPPGLAMVNNTANEAMRCHFEGREWPLQG